jgi:uncharacterized protein (TIGR03086 family)
LTNSTAARSAAWRRSSTASEPTSSTRRRPARSGLSKTFSCTSAPSTGSTPGSSAATLGNQGVPLVDLGDGAAQAYRGTISPLLEAWQQPGALQRELELPVGRRSAELALWVHLRETLVHGWDLAAATRQRAFFDDEVVEASLAHAQQLNPAPAARPAGLGFADAVDAPTGAEPITRLAGRVRRAGQRALTITAMALPDQRPRLVRQGP